MHLEGLNCCGFSIPVASIKCDLPVLTGESLLDYSALSTSVLGFCSSYFSKAEGINLLVRSVQVTVGVRSWCRSDGSARRRDVSYKLPMFSSNGWIGVQD